MSVDKPWTRRAALQGIATTAAAAIVPTGVFAKPAGGAGRVPWREAQARAAQRLTFFTAKWRFYRGDAPGAEAAGFQDAHWRLLDVPHDWSIEDRDVPAGANGAGTIWTEGTPPTRTGPFDLLASQGQGATGWTVGGTGWYRKTFAKPRLSQGGTAQIIFDGVYMNADVWLNGVHLGNHPYGYTEFAFDLTPHLRDGENTIAVRVNNAGRNSRWYSGSGIFRKVWLSLSGPLRIPVHGVYVTTLEVSAEAALVNLDVMLHNGGAQAAPATLRARLVDAAGRVAATAQTAVTVAGNGKQAARCAFHVTRPHLWSPRDPHLYRAEVLLETEGRLADATTQVIGIRKVEIDASHGLRINGESVKLRGGCVHHDNGPLGSAAIPRAEERRVELLKAQGFNAIRTSHNPPSPDFLNACDRLGMLVIDEAFDCWEDGKNPQDYHLYFRQWWRRDLESMIQRDRNHPSVILWSIGNEIHERAEPQGLAIGHELATYVHSLDPTRKVTAAICGPWDHPKQTWRDMQPAFSYLDVGGYNYELQQYQPDHVTYPQRVMVGTESFPNQAYQNWQAIEKDSWVLGDFVWTAMDYLGESGIGHATIANHPGPDDLVRPYPWFNSYCGDIDLIGNKKPQSYYRDVVWRRSPVEMAVQRPVPQGWTETTSPWGWSDELRSWTWPGLEGTPLTVRVYTRADEVKLWLNGAPAGEKRLTPADALQAEFTVPYRAGVLKAVAYEQGREVGAISFRTAGPARRLHLTADRRRLAASRDDLSYVMVTVVDAEGQPLPDTTVPVSFELRGVGELAAVGSADPKDVASFRQPHRRTFHGQCLAIVRPQEKPGAIELRATSPGLEPTSIRLEVTSHRRRPFT